jgi:O-antigen/teichoic acid export membrane protein
MKLSLKSSYPFRFRINNVSALQFFQLARYATLFLINIIFAKSYLFTAHYLTIQDIGSYEMFIFITGIVSTFWVNGLIQALLPLYKNNSTFSGAGIINDKKSPILFNTFLVILAFSILAVIVLALFKDVISNVFFDTNKIPFWRLLLVYILIGNPTFLIEYIYLLKNQSGKIFLYGTLTFSLHLFLVSFPALTGLGLAYCIYGLIAITIIKFFWLLFLLKKYAKPVISLQFVKEYLSFATPLILSALLAVSAQYVDGFLIKLNFDLTKFAIFKYGARELPIALLMANALSNAMIPEFSDSSKLDTPLKQLKRRTIKLAHVLFPLTFFFLISSRWLFPVIFSEKFIESALIFNIYLLLISTRLLFPQPIIIGLKKNSIVLLASSTELIVNILLSVIFIGVWGIEGVAYATIIAFFIQKLIWIIYLKVNLNIAPESYIPLKVILLYTFLIFITFVFVRLYLF